MTTIDKVVANRVDNYHLWYEDYMRTLYRWAEEEDAKLIYEVGIFTAKSTAAFLVSLSHRDGRLISCDINPHTERMMEYADLERFWTCRIMSSKDFIETLSEQADMVYLDGSHTYDAVSHELRGFWPLVKPGGLIIVHDIGIPEEKKIIEDWLPENAEVQYIPIGPGFAKVRKL